MHTMIRRVFRLASAVLVSLGVLLIAATASAVKYPKLDRLRILNQNIMNKPWPAFGNYGVCNDDNVCRAREVAEAVLKGDYDVVVLQEQFHGDSLNELIFRLSPTFPYYMGEIENTPIGQAWVYDWLMEMWAVSPLTGPGCCRPRSLMESDA